MIIKILQWTVAILIAGFMYKFAIFENDSTRVAFWTGFASLLVQQLYWIYIDLFSRNVD